MSEINFTQMLEILNSDLGLKERRQWFCWRLCNAHRWIRNRMMKFQLNFHFTSRGEILKLERAEHIMFREIEVSGRWGDGEHSFSFVSLGLQAQTAMLETQMKYMSWKDWSIKSHSNYEFQLVFILWAIKGNE